MSYEPLKNKWGSVKEMLDDLYRVIETPNHPEQKKARQIIGRVWKKMIMDMTPSIPEEELWSVS